MSTPQEPTPQLQQSEHTGTAQRRNWRLKLSITGSVAGLAMFLTGAALSARLGLLSAYAAPLLVLGPVLLVLVLLWNRDLRQAGPLLRRAFYLLNVFLGAALLLGSLVILNVLVAQYGPAPFDWTEASAFTLSTQTKNLLAGLEKPVHVYVVYQPSSFRSLIEQTLDLYRAESGKIEVTFIDPYADQLEVAQLYNRFPDAKTGEPVVVVSYGEGERPESHVVKHGDIFRAVLRADNPFAADIDRTEYQAEDAFTSAINRLIEARKTTLYFTTGHGELDLENSSEENRGGIGLLKERLESKNIVVRSVDLQKSGVPGDCDILTVAGPKNPFLPAEVAHLREYMTGDGRMIVLLDPGMQMAEQGHPTTGLEELLAEFQVTVGDDLIIESPLVSYRSQAEFLTLVTGRESTNPIVDQLLNQRLLFTLARRVEPAGPEPAPGSSVQSTAPYRAEALLTTTAAAWAETDYRNRSFKRDETDTTGPVGIAVAVSQTEGGNASGHPPTGPPPSVGRMVVVGDSDFASNPSLDQGGNYALFSNAVNWLRGRMELLGIPPKEKKTVQLTLGAGDFRRLVLAPILTVSLLVMVSGMFIWVVRRQV